MNVFMVLLHVTLFSGNLIGGEGAVERAVEISKALQKNTTLSTLNLSGMFTGYMLGCEQCDVM